MAITDQAILSDVQALLAEPRTGGMTWPSGMWSQAEILGYLNVAQLDLVATTGLIAKHGTIVCVPHILRHDLPEDVVEILRAVWVRALDGRRFPLDKTDIWELDAVLYSGTANWRTESKTPSFYTVGDVPTRTIQLAPAPPLPGSLELVYVPTPAAFTGLGAGSDVPDDASVILVWDTVRQSLVKEGRGKDPARAAVAAGFKQVASEAVRLLLRGWVE